MHSSRSDCNRSSSEAVIREDFATFRNAGLTGPLMGEIEKVFASAGGGSRQFLVLRAVRDPFRHHSDMVKIMAANMASERTAPLRRCYWKLRST